MDAELLLRVTFAVFVGLFGLAVGSFLNVCIWRIPRGESLSKDRSHCPHCGMTLRARDLVPVLSWLLLRGRCRGCGERISPRYPVVELLGAGLWLAVWFAFGPTVSAAVYAPVCSALIVATFVDWDHRIIPDRIHVVILALSVPLILWGGARPWQEHVIGLFVLSVPLYLFATFVGGFGHGDAKLMGACGLLLGWKLILLAFAVSSVLGASAGLILIARKKATRKSMIAYGPWLCMGVAFALFFGDRVIAWYLHLAGL